LPRIDAHQHFWKYSTAEYGWIAQPELKRSFLPADLRPLIGRAGIDATVAVEARNKVEETRWLLELAQQNPWIAGVVGWLPVAEPGFDELLERFAADPKLAGIRVMNQWPVSIDPALRSLTAKRLALDIHPGHDTVKDAIAVVDRHPNLVFVVDHLAKPRIREGLMEPWRKDFRELARRPNVYTKLSGLVNAANPKSWTVTQLEPYVETALDAFGPQRVMFASDWPVCLLGTQYSPWVQVVEHLLSNDEQPLVFEKAAAAAYSLSSRSLVELRNGQMNAPRK
jgi:L-fuconolactonase